MHCVTAGAVGEWWFGAHDVNTIQRAQTRALTTSLGSICLGSLLVAALNALHTLLLSVPRRKATGSANACLEFLVKLVTRNLLYFNKFAFCQVAIYGKDFRTAGRDTMRLFRDRGWSALLNDTLVSSVLAVGCLVVGTLLLQYSLARWLACAHALSLAVFVARVHGCQPRCDVVLVMSRRIVRRDRLRVVVFGASMQHGREGRASARVWYVQLGVGTSPSLLLETGFPLPVR